MLSHFAIDYNALRKALVEAVQKVTELTCIEAEPETQNVPRPCLPYFTLKLIGPAVKLGDDSASNIPATTIWNRGGIRKLTVDFNCYGRSHEEAYMYMSHWQSSLELETVQALLEKAGIAVWLNNDVKDVSALLNSGFEGRAQMDVDFGIASNLTEDLSNIEIVNTSGTITSDQNVENELNVTVP